MNECCKTTAKEILDELGDLLAVNEVDKTSLEILDLLKEKYTKI